MLKYDGICTHSRTWKTNPRAGKKVVGTGRDRKRTGLTYKLFCQILCHSLLPFPDPSTSLPAMISKLIEEISKMNSTPPWTISSTKRLPAGGCCRSHVESLTWGWEPECSLLCLLPQANHIPLDFWAMTVWNGRTSPAPGKYSRAPFPSLYLIPLCTGKGIFKIIFYGHKRSNTSERAT